MKILFIKMESGKTCMSTSLPVIHKGYIELNILYKL